MVFILIVFFISAIIGLAIKFFAGKDVDMEEQIMPLVAFIIILLGPLVVFIWLAFV